MGSQSRTQMRDWTELKINLICLLATLVQFSYVQLLSRVRLFATPWIAAHQASLSITNSRSSPKPMSIELVMPSSHLILCRSLLLLPPIPPSIRVFSNESTLRMRWPKYWSFSFSITCSNEHPGLISFRMDWLDLLAVQGTLKSLLQHHSSKASILWHSVLTNFTLIVCFMGIGQSWSRKILKSNKDVVISSHILRESSTWKGCRIKSIEQFPPHYQKFISLASAKWEVPQSTLFSF